MIYSKIEIMKTQLLKVYQTPSIEKIELDNEISLVLASDPPVGPGEEGKNNVAPEYFNNEPYGKA